MKISPARAAAFDVLLKIERDRAFSSILLPEYEASLSEKDRSLCHQLVLGVLRRLMFLDATIAHLAGERRLDLEVRIALRIGLFQLLELDRVPDHSAVNESVLLAQRAKKTSAKGFVNALLRRAVREGISLDFGSEIERLSVETSHPGWLIERWSRQFGPERAASIAAANNQPSRPSFRFTLKDVCEDVYVLDGSASSDIVEGAFTAERMTAAMRRMAELGEIYFQDEASQLVANIASAVHAGSIFDVCAAPGSKTSLMAKNLAENAGSVVAGDVYQPRVEFLSENCRRQGLRNVFVVRYDAEASLPFADFSFDTVLVDAPCSGTGTIRSNPEIRHFLGLDDFAELQAKQLRILTNASKLVAGGGRLVYSTCSLERDENEEVIEKFLTENGNFRVDFGALPERFRTSEGFARTFPDRDGTDGFFIAELRQS